MLPVELKTIVSLIKLSYIKNGKLSIDKRDDIIENIDVDDGKWNQGLNRLFNGKSRYDIDNLKLICKKSTNILKKMITKDVNFYADICAENTLFNENKNSLLLSKYFAHFCLEKVIIGTYNLLQTYKNSQYSKSVENILYKPFLQLKFDLFREKHLYKKCENVTIYCPEKISKYIIMLKSTPIIDEFKEQIKLIMI